MLYEACAALLVQEYTLSITRERKLSIRLLSEREENFQKGLSHLRSTNNLQVMLNFNCLSRKWQNLFRVVVRGGIVRKGRPEARWTLPLATIYRFAANPTAGAPLIPL